MTHDHPLTYSIAEAAAMIPCSEDWLTKRLRDGTFTARKIQRQWRLTMGDIDSIIDACTSAGRDGPRTAREQRAARESLASFRRRDA
jgi:hypothetical protein